MRRSIFPYNLLQSLSRVFLVIILCLGYQVALAQEEGTKEVYDTVERQQPPVEDYGNSYKEDDFFYKTSDTLSVTERNVPGPEIQKLKEDKDFWYANANVKSKKTTGVTTVEEPGKGTGKNKARQTETEEQEDATYTPITQQGWFQTLLWLVIITVFAIVIIMYLSNSNVGLFRKKIRKVDTGDDELESTEDIFAINYQKEIDRAAAQGNYRLATRLMFLRLLKSMAEKNIIQYKQDKTNLDYLMELHPTSYYKHFFRITRNYEYSWYGLFPVSEEAYKVIKADFNEFEHTLR